MIIDAHAHADQEYSTVESMFFLQILATSGFGWVSTGF